MVNVILEILKNWASPVGLIFDLIGVTIVFYYSLPDPQNNASMPIIGLAFTDFLANKKNATKKRWSKLGFVIIIIGFFSSLAQCISGFNT